AVTRRPRLRGVPEACLLRYWLILSEFPPVGGGIATYGREMTAALRAAGHEVRVFLPGQPDQLGTLTSVQPNGTQVVRVALTAGDVLDQALGWWQLFSYRVRDEVLARIADGERPDFIEVQDYGAPGYYLLKHRLLHDGALNGIPIMLSCRSPLFEIA